MSESEGFDRSALAKLRLIGGDALVSEILGLFLEHVPKRLAAARLACGRGEIESVQVALHSVISSAANIGAGELEELARRGELMARRGNRESAAALLERIDEAYARIEASVKAEREGLGRVKRIAVVEDNADNRLLVRAILESRFEIVEYGTGVAALEGCRANPPDLVLLDISLPGMDGAEVLRRLRAEEALKGVPVVALTAHALAGAREEYLAMGFDDYVSKPIVDAGALRGLVERHLGR